MLHCLDLMLEDIGKMKQFSKPIARARQVTFIYRHRRLREKTGGRDLFRPGVTRFATAFLTLRSLHTHKDALKFLFVSDDWTKSKLATTVGKKVHDTILSTKFWNSHQVVGSKQPLHRFCGGKACLGLSLPQTPLMWEPPTLGLPFFFS